MKAVTIKEHEKLDDEIIKKLQNSSFLPNPNNEYLGAPNYLNIDKSYTASYFIGATWLSDDVAVVIKPKIENIDFIDIFERALKIEDKKASEYFARCYGVDTNAPFVETKADFNMLTALLILHYIHLLKRLVKKGLRKDYITKTENLKTKVKGRILLSKNLQKNISQKRDDRVMCVYSEYCVDTLENRLLKKALIIAKRNLHQAKANKHSAKINQLLSRFQSVGDEIELNEIRHFRTHKIYKEYGDALRVARMILRRFENVLDENSSNEKKIPPFWIDMSRLYEMYVYSRILENSTINVKFQVGGHFGTAVDFIATNGDEKWIMDAKYKPRYDGSNSGVLADIREISGYARDTKILRELGASKNEENEVKCLIIHPDKITKIDNDEVGEIIANQDELNDKIDFKGLDDKLSKKFHNFYKLVVALPLREK